METGQWVSNDKICLDSKTKCGKGEKLNYSKLERCSLGKEGWKDKFPQELHIWVRELKVVFKADRIKEVIWHL